MTSANNQDKKRFFLQVPEGYFQMEGEEAKQADLAIAREIQLQLGITPDG